MSWFHCLIPLALCAAAGCQHYTPMPLDLEGHGRQAAARDYAGQEVAAFAGALAAHGGAAREYDPSDGLTLSEAEVVALFFNPDLRRERLKARVPRAAAKEAGRWEDPVLNVDVERILRSVSSPWVIASTLGVTIPLSGRLDVEKHRAFAEADVEQVRVYLEEQAVLAELRKKWIEWDAAHERLRLTKAYVKELGPLVESAKKLADLGELSRTDARVFEVERAVRNVEIEGLAAAAQDAGRHLNALMGLSPDAPVTLVAGVPAGVDAGGAGARMTSAMAGNPRLRLAVAEHQLAEHAMHLEIRKQFPDVVLGAGGSSDEGQARVLLNGSIPLPLWNQNKGGIARAAAARAAAKAGAEAAAETVVHEVTRAEDALAAARRRAGMVEKELIPLVDRQLNEARELMRIGEFNSLVLLEALRSAHQAKLQIIEVRAAEAAAVAELRGLVGSVSGKAAPVQRKETP